MERKRTESVLELIEMTGLQVEEELPKNAVLPAGVWRGVISTFDETTGNIRILLPRLSTTEPIVAQSTVPISQADVGREVLVAFEEGDARNLFIVGFLWRQAQRPPAQQSPHEVKVDGEQVVLTGKNEVVLRCGKASITLTSAGKILIRGAYLLSQSSGVNRIQGGSVQVN